MNSQRDAGLSRYLSMGLVPLCAWGMLSALLLHLIALRSVFIQGGEARLRLAVISFAGGVVMLQRLAATQGGEHAATYKWALILTMGLFTLHFTMSYELPVHSGIILFANAVIFTVLYWVGMRITRACAVDSDDKSAVAVETGIFSRARKLRVDDDVQDAPRPRKKSLFGTDDSPSPAQPLTWQEKLAPEHPGRVLFYFSLFAIPAFGFGGLLLGSNGSALLGMTVFLYLFCALALLFLSSFGQLAAYFEHRNVVLPEVIGITWLSLGFLVIAIIVGLSFLLPQPQSAGGDYVRDRLVARYSGWQANTGFREAGPGKTSGKGSGDSPGSQSGGTGKQSGSPGGKQQAGGNAAQAKASAQASREAGLDKAYIKPDKTGVQAAQEGFGKIFDFLLKGVAVVATVAGVIVAIVIVMAVWAGISGRSAEIRNLFPKRNAVPKKEREPKKRDRSRKFQAIREPSVAGVANSADDLVHYLWDATLARCADAGEPCEPDQTPLEFLRTDPKPLRRIQTEAHALARWLLYAEYSGQPVPQSALPELMDYWRRLKSVS